MIALHSHTRQSMLRATTLLVLFVCMFSAISAFAAIPAGYARIHYYRPDAKFTGWTLWTWGASTENQTTWCQTELQPTGTDSYGAYWDVSIDSAQNGGDLGFIVHNCSTGVKDPGPDMHLQVTQYTEAWVISGDPNVYTTQPTAQQLLNGVFNAQQGYWIDRRHILVQSQYFNSDWTYYLNTSPNGGLQIGSNGLTGGTSVQLTAGGTLTADELHRYPQLASYAVFTIPNTVTLPAIQQDLKGQVAISAVDSTNSLKYATGLQFAGALDDLYYYSGTAGRDLQSARQRCSGADQVVGAYSHQRSLAALRHRS